MSQDRRRPPSSPYGHESRAPPSQVRQPTGRRCGAGELVAASRDAYLPGLAMSVNNFAGRLAETVRRAEGLTAAQEAVELYWELAEVMAGLIASVTNRITQLLASSWRCLANSATDSRSFFVNEGATSATPVSKQTSQFLA